MEIMIIGGGAAGMMAAITAAGAGAHVTVMESGNLLGKKILSTGNGRCNLTNLALDPERYEGSFRKHAALLLKEYGVEDCLRFFDSIGIPTVSAGSARGDEAWVYPACKEASAVRMILDMECERRGVKRLLSQKAVAVEKKNGLFHVYASSKECFTAERLIITSGGCAAPKTGSDGSGYALAAAFGHSIIPPVPALGALVSNRPCCKQLAGIRAEAKASLYLDNQECGFDKGEIQFTDYGLSGIPIFQLSAKANRALSQGRSVSIRLDLQPDTPLRELVIQLTERKLRRGKGESGTLLLGMLPAKMVPAFYTLSHIRLHQTCHDINQDQLSSLAYCIKNLEFQITDHKGFDACQLTAGGIPGGEVSLYLESIFSRGLYFAGEILDLHGPCGGYNLQWAWTSGHAAGLAAAREN